MCSSGNSRTNEWRLCRVDYPKCGIDEPDWQHVSPTAPESWEAYELVSPESAWHGVFLGSGHTSLTIEPNQFGSDLFLALSGFVYSITISGIVQAFPTRYRGYEKCIQGDSLVAFCNYAELLVITCHGTVFYDPKIAIDDLDVRFINGDLIGLTGMRTYDVQEDWTVDVNSLPLWQPTPQESKTLVDDEGNV